MIFAQASFRLPLRQVRALLALLRKGVPVVVEFDTPKAQGLRKSNGVSAAGETRIRVRRAKKG